MNDERMQRYSEIIIEHSQFPRHHGTLEQHTHEGHGENPFCGDRIKLQFALNNEGVIEHAAVESVGCAISLASASLLATHLHGLNLQQAEELFERVHKAILEKARMRPQTSSWENWRPWRLPAGIHQGLNARLCPGMF